MRNQATRSAGLNRTASCREALSQRGWGERGTVDEAPDVCGQAEDAAHGSMPAARPRPRCDDEALRGAAAMAVQSVHNLAEYNAAVTGAGDRLVVVDFSATWCGVSNPLAMASSRRVLRVWLTLPLQVWSVQDDSAYLCAARPATPERPLHQGRCRRGPGAPTAFASIPQSGSLHSFLGAHLTFIDKDVAQACGVRSMPTFWFLRRSVQLESFSGADAPRLEARTAMLALEMHGVCWRCGCGG